MTQTEALEIVAELCADNVLSDREEAILRKALANHIPDTTKMVSQPEHEPVAIRHSFDGYGYLYTDMGFGSGWVEWTKRSHKDAEPLYTTPPQRTWVDMTEAEADNIYKGASTFGEMMRMVEAKLKEKNT